MKRKFVIKVEEGTTIGCTTCKLIDCCIAQTNVDSVLPFLNCSNYNLDTIDVQEIRKEK